MHSIKYKRATSREELEQIIALQVKNHTDSLPLEEKNQEGFVSVQHSIALLEKMNRACAHILVKENENVVGFALVMLTTFRKEIKMLIPMFERIDKLVFKNEKYVIMGQICIHKKYRQQGLFKGMYAYFKAELQSEYNCVFTEVSLQNKRSIEAHKAVGFQDSISYTADGITWSIIRWDWT
ncbi:GNAT family N-acetyltransferase [Flavobacterium sp.]|uniref:GNAT family N-acetyltransferase n=1 Tax=Flavobacterium sp. TaxID=239 RepID=UPI00262B8DCF|nr:GNAT family N-acetyltransferase [Flavobacterium sp.]MDG2430875.1 GNAT family N-acetyltransferase [Flavobacterium sp.]